MLSEVRKEVKVAWVENVVHSGLENSKIQHSSGKTSSKQWARWFGALRFHKV